MHTRIQHRFSKCLARHGQRLYPLYAFITDKGAQIFSGEQIERAFHLLEQIAMHLILKNQIGFLFEVADFDVGTRYKPFRIGMKQQGRRPFKIISFHKAQLIEQTFVVVFQICGIHTPATPGILAKQIKCGVIQIFCFEVWNRHAIPRLSLLAQHKPIERRAFQLLIGRTTANIVMPVITDRVRVWIGNYLNILFARFGQKINIYHDSQQIAHLVGNVFHQLFGVLHALHLALIVNANKQATTLRIGKAAYPFEIFVSPSQFVFYVLLLGFHACSSKGEL